VANQMNMSHKEIEQGTDLALDFEKLTKVAQCGQPLVPVAVQDADSGDVLIVAYANEIAMNYALEHGVAAFWSTSRNELWVKGATSGDLLDIVEVRVNCDQNSLLYRVRPRGEGACHAKDANGKAHSSCYYRRISDGTLEFVS